MAPNCDPHFFCLKLECYLPTQQHTNMGPARALGRCETLPCVSARVVSRSVLSARVRSPREFLPAAGSHGFGKMFAHTDQPSCFDPAWCGVLRTRRHGLPPLSFPVGHEPPAPGYPTKEPHEFPSAARLRFLARLGPFVRCRAVCMNAQPELDSLDCA